MSAGSGLRRQPDGDVRQEELHQRTDGDRVQHGADAHVPPSAKPTTSTVSSIPILITRRLRPVRAASPVIRPSRGPGPRWVPM